MEFQPEGTVFLELILRDDDANKEKLDANINNCDDTNNEYEIVTRELYSWNKVTTCIYNLFGTGNLWADVYGECLINCTRQSIKQRKLHLGKNRALLRDSTAQEIETPEAIENEARGQNTNSVMKCKLEFLSASGGGYWRSNKRQPHEIQGSILNDQGKY